MLLQIDVRTFMNKTGFQPETMASSMNFIFKNHRGVTCRDSISNIQYDPNTWTVSFNCSNGLARHLGLV